MTHKREVMEDVSGLPKGTIFAKLVAAIEQSDYQFSLYLCSILKKLLETDTDYELFRKLQLKLPEKPCESNLSEGPEWTLLSDFEKNQVVQEGISIVSCCMNRNENLVKALQSWVKLPVDEIIIVDWSSEQPVERSIAHIKDERIKILRVEGESKWVLTYGFNIGLRLARFNKIYKFDADILVKPDFLVKNYFKKGEYVRGDWKLALDAGCDDQVFVNGSFGAFKEDLAEVGYYNEFITTYGWDDSDLYQRLSYNRRLRAVALEPSSLIHAEQKAEERIKHQDLTDSLFLGKVEPTELSNLKNQIFVGIKNYWHKGLLQDFKKVNAATTFERVTSTDNVGAEALYDAEVYAAQRFLYQYASDLLRISNNHKALSSFLLSEYKNAIPYSDSKKLLFSLFDNSTCIQLDFGNTDQVSEYGKRILSSDTTELLEVLFPSFFSTLRDNNSTNINPNKFFVDAQHGLGNRLRAIGSAAAIAKATGKELVIVWEPDHHCECRFSDLFDYDGEVIEKSFLEQAKKDGDVFNYMEIEEGAEKDKPIVVKPTKYVYARAAYTFVHEASHWEAENEFIKALKPSKQVMDLIAPFNVDGHIAAHIRMEAGAGLDHNTYDSVENWTQEGHDQLHFWREKSHYSAFIKRIDKLIEEDSNLKLFVATDLQETYDIFEKYYGDRLVYLKRSVFDRSKEQIIYALADVILLSKCKKLLGSTWSSFSEAAMRLSNTYSEIEMSGKDF